MTYTPLLVAVVVQALLGLVFLVGFIAVMRRYIDKEVPALFVQVNEKIAQLSQRVDRISREFHAFELRFERHIGRFEAQHGLESTGAGGQTEG